LKLHGLRQPSTDPNHDSYVITEDHYIEYLTHTDLDELLPASVLTRLLNCHLLFLGYSLRDWNLRAILYQLREKAKPNDWWAVRRDFDPVEQKTWAKKNVTNDRDDPGGLPRPAEERFRDLARRPLLTQHANVTGATGPYKGLTHFTEADAAFFFRA